MNTSETSLLRGVVVRKERKSRETNYLIGVRAMSSDIIYHCPNKECEGNGFVVGKEGAYWTCGYCGTLLQRKYDLPMSDEDNKEKMMIEHQHILKQYDDQSVDSVYWYCDKCGIEFIESRVEDKDE